MVEDRQGEKPVDDYRGAGANIRRYTPALIKGKKKPVPEPEKNN